MRRKKLPRRLNPLEVVFFKMSMKLLFNSKNGSFVIDDELMASKAADVECKTVSTRKTGKEGPVAVLNPRNVIALPTQRLVSCLVRG